MADTQEERMLRQGKTQPTLASFSCLLYGANGPQRYSQTFCRYKNPMLSTENNPGGD